MRYAKFTRPLTVALAPEVYDALKDKSDAERISIAELVRDILRETVLLSLYGNESKKKQAVKEEERENE